jgi:peptidoglycan hydrolase-like protein with peptidoglycan-binding domain
MDLGLTSAGGTNMLLFFNVNSHVGRNRANSWDDVMIVQYLLQKLGKAGVPIDMPELAAQFAAITPSGDFDDDTEAAIRAFQQRFGAMAVDGVVSPAHNVTFQGAHYTIWLLNFLTRDQFPNWPRLQDAADCPSRLKSMVKAIL